MAGQDDGGPPRLLLRSPAVPHLGPDEAQLRARVSAHARRLFIEGGHETIQAFADKLKLGHPMAYQGDGRRA